MFEVTDIGEHGENSFDDHTHIPFPTLTDAQILRMPISFCKAGIREDHHVVPEFIDEMLKSGTIVDIGGGALPVDNASEVVKDETEFATNNPALVRAQRAPAFFADLRRAASFTTRVQQFNPVTVDHSNQTGWGHEVTDETPMAVEQAKKPCPTRQVGKQGSIVAAQLAPKGARSAAFQAIQQGQRHHSGAPWARIELGLLMFGRMADLVIYLAM